MDKVVRKGREEGSMEVCKADRSLEEGDELVNMEEVGKELEDGVVVLVEVEVADEEDEVRNAGSGSVTGGKGGCGFKFLDCLEGDSKEEVLEKKTGGSKEEEETVWWAGEAEGIAEHDRVAKKGERCEG